MGYVNEELNDGVYIDLDEKYDVDISKISSCKSRSLDECERWCPKFYSCQTVADANDILIEYA